jgi:microcystin-dependent protein
VGGYFLLFLWLGVVWLSYADLDGVPSQTAGVSSLLASDWNTYVRDNFDSIKFGHVVVANNAAKSAISAVQGVMVYQSDVDTLFLFNGTTWVPAVDTVSLVDSAVETAKINALAVTTAKIDDLAVTTGKVNDLAVTTGKINDLAVTTGKIDASAVTSAKIADNTIVLGDLATALQAFLVPTGTVSAFAGSAAPTGYLLCNGDTVPNGSGTVQSVTADYAALYAVVGSSYGTAGKIPDLRGRTIIGVGTGTEITGVLGTVQGAKEVTLSAAQSGVPAHTHPINVSATTDGAGAHEHNIRHTDQGFASPNSASGHQFIMGNLNGYGNYGAGVTLLAQSAGAHDHTIPANTAQANTTAAAASAHTNIQPSLPLNYIIKY